MKNEITKMNRQSTVEMCYQLELLVGYSLCFAKHKNVLLPLETELRLSLMAKREPTVSDADLVYFKKVWEEYGKYV